MNSILLKGVFSAGVSFDSKMWKIATRFFFKFSKLTYGNYIFSVLLATSSAHLEDLAYLDEQRHTPLRTSLRMPRQSMGGVRTQQDLRGQNTEGWRGA